MKKTTNDFEDSVAGGDAGHFTECSKKAFSDFAISLLALHSINFMARFGAQFREAAIRKAPGGTSKPREITSDRLTENQLL